MCTTTALALLMALLARGSVRLGARSAEGGEAEVKDTHCVPFQAGGGGPLRDVQRDVGQVGQRYSERGG